MGIPFIKMAASSNDFIIVDNRSGDFQVSPAVIRKMSDRKTFGCDQFIILENSQKADVFMRIFNADGSEAGACGNATRCVADLIIKEIEKEKIDIETISGILPCWRDGEMISVNMGKPSFEWKDMKTKLEYIKNHQIEQASDLEFDFCSIGNPHLVFLDKEFSKLDIKNELWWDKDSPLARTIDYSPIANNEYFKDFSQRIIFHINTNIEYIYAVNQNHIRIRVWERGVGETDCCGTGACASVVIAAKKGLVKRNEKVEAEFKGGSLWVNWQNDGDIIMTGGFEYVGKGEYETK
ncbi:diaminopimelate epimerase [Flavobacteriaceae bacterium]|nr:diaminopimelate epimerase [Flavobacteriaceae bacterium]